MPEVFADGARLQAALMNLALNAREAMPEGGRLAIDVSLADVEIVPGKRATSVVFTVADTGVGIPREHLERIFEPFFTTKQEGKGSGLGLAMVYGFATQSAGKLSVESEVGAGTTFRLVLPALRDTPRVDQQAPAGVVRPFTARSVLLVEADPEVRRTVQTLLRSIGHEVFGVANAEQALQSLRSEAAFDILLADLDLPGGLDGWALADAAVALAPRCHVLLMSGSGDVPPGQNGPRPYRVLAKPFRVDDLRDAIMAL
jgi:CheY-like chemotaxis protein